MKQIKLDVQYLGTIGVFICTLVGFYYTTTYRLDELEKKVETLETEYGDKPEITPEKDKVLMSGTTGILKTEWIGLDFC